MKLLFSRFAVVYCPCVSKIDNLSKDQSDMYPSKDCIFIIYLLFGSHASVCKKTEITQEEAYRFFP